MEKMMMLLFLLDLRYHWSSSCCISRSDRNHGRFVRGHSSSFELWCFGNIFCDYRTDFLSFLNILRTSGRLLTSEFLNGPRLGATHFLLSVYFGISFFLFLHYLLLI
jgi:hypothetical protein